MAGKVIFTAQERFWQRVVKSETCWNWQRLGDKGYGVLRIRGQSIYAHRYSWMIHRGPVPSGMWIMHKCDNRACVNPDHLEVGTPLQNNRDMWAKGRQRFRGLRGAQNPAAKLDESRVRRIKELSRSGLSQHQIANDVGTTRGNVQSIVTGKTWGHVG